MSVASSSSSAPLDLPENGSSPTRCTLCKRPLPADHIYKRCDPCRMKIKEQGERRKSRQAQRAAVVLQSTKDDLLKRSSEELASDASKRAKATYPTERKSKKPPLVYPDGADFTNIQTMDALYDAIKAQGGKRQIQLRVSHCMVSDAKVNEVKRAALVAGQIQGVCGFPLGTGHVSLDSAGRGCRMVFKPEPEASRLNGAVKIWVSKENSHEFGFPGQKISVEIEY